MKRVSYIVGTVSKSEGECNIKPDIIVNIKLVPIKAGYATILDIYRESRKRRG